MFNNKRGEEKIISVYWFIILLLVATGIIIMVNIFYGSPYDIRIIEAEILSENIANCVEQGGKFNSDLFSETEVFKEEFRDNFLEHCAITFQTQYDFEEMEYYSEINITEKRNPKNLLFQIIEGNPNFKSDCDLDSKKHQKLVQCVQKEFFLKQNEKIYSIKMITMVRKTEQNVK
jgi:hypothetical protein